jgi:hypothetical protein
MSLQPPTPPLRCCRLQASRLLVRGGTVVNADATFKADVYCEDGIIRCGAPPVFVL